MKFRFAAPLLALAIFFCSLTARSQQKFDVPKICFQNAHETVMSDNASSMQIPPIILEAGSAQDIYNTALMNEEAIFFAGWLLQDPSHLNIARASFLVQNYNTNLLVKELAGLQNAGELFNGAARAPAQYSAEALAQAKAMMDKIMKSSPDSSLARIKKNAAILCAPYWDTGCPAALRDAVDLMASRAVDFKDWGVMVSMPPVVQRIVADPGLVQGAAHFGLKFLSRLYHGPRAFASAPKLLDDIRRSYVATGSTPAQADDRAWTLLGFYGTRGSSLVIMNPLPNKENLPVWASLMEFSASLAALDGASLNEPYSYPDQVKSNCAYGRPYHFWLAAYLSRFLRMKGHSVKSAVIAPHLLSKLYEFDSGTMTRDTERPYRDKFFNPYNVMLQTNMAYDDAGAFYGAGAAGGNPISVDAGLELIFEKAKPMPVLTPKELEEGMKSDLTRYQWFNRVIAPDAWIARIFRISDSN